MLVVTAANGCTVEAAYQVIDASATPDIATSGNILSCTATSVQINGATSVADATFEWSGPNNFTADIANPMVSTAGMYTLIVTDNSNGCSDMMMLEVEADEDIPQATIEGQVLDCNLTEFTLEVCLAIPTSLFHGRDLVISRPMLPIRWSLRQECIPFY